MFSKSFKNIINVFSLHRVMSFILTLLYMYVVCLAHGNPCLGGWEEWVSTFSERSSNVIFHHCSREPLLAFMKEEVVLCSFSYMLQWKYWDNSEDKNSFYRMPWYWISWNKILYSNLFFRPYVIYVCATAFIYLLYRCLNIWSNRIFVGISGVTKFTRILIKNKPTTFCLFCSYLLRALFY